MPNLRPNLSDFVEPWTVTVGVQGLRCINGFKVRGFSGLRFRVWGFRFRI